MSSFFIKCIWRGRKTLNFVSHQRQLFSFRLLFPGVNNNARAISTFTFQIRPETTVEKVVRKFKL